MGSLRRNPRIGDGGKEGNENKGGRILYYGPPPPHTHTLHIIDTTGHNYVEGQGEGVVSSTTFLLKNGESLGTKLGKESKGPAEKGGGIHWCKLCLVH